MSHWTVLMVLFATALGFCGCATHSRHGVDPERARQIEEELFHPHFTLSPELEERILALDPAHVSGKDIEDVLAHAPAPRIIKIRGGINIRGGILPVYRRMLSFTEFLLGMGYPGLSLTNPADGSYAYSCYENSRKMAGLIAWYYEREGLRPVIVGHSQGGMQAIKILHRLAEPASHPIPLWNPLTDQREAALEFTDPLSGNQRPVTSLVLPYVTAVGAGGLTRALPNQWEMNTKLRTIPDSVEEFTGFCKGLDLWGGDYLGFGPANHYRPNGNAKVRNVWLPEQYSHVSIPETSHLAQDPAIKDWLNNYQPSPEPMDSPKLDVSFDANSRNILWAAEVWYSIKKHWVLELQRYIRAKRAQRHEP
jgi:hypothetical protein